MSVDFFHERKEQHIDAVNLKKDEKRARDEDWEDIQDQRRYRDTRIEEWRRSARVYNVLQNATSTDDISNLVIGYTRMIVDAGITSISQGSPEFDFDPIGPSDHNKTVLWSSMMEMLLNRTNFSSQQNIFITDWHVFGTACYEVYSQKPFRTERVPNLDGTITEIVKPDFRRPRVGVRALSPFRVTRNSTVSDPNEVPSCTKEEVLTWNQFVQNYGRVFLPNKKHKYKNVKVLPKGTHVKVTHYWDEIRDIYRIYALPYGSEIESESRSVPDALGIPIFDKPLKIHEIKKGGKTLRSEGLNIPGICPLVFATYNDVYDSNLETHDVYGMGIPKHIEAIDTLMQTFFNMTVDNWRLSNTVLLSYQGDGRNVPDFDATEYYGGELFEGTVTPVPLGQSSTRDMDEITTLLNNLSIPMTGINFQNITGDTSKTAFEFSQRLRANSQRAEQKLKVLEEGPYKRLGTLLLSAGLTDLTFEDVEALTEDQIEDAKSNIKAGKETREDFRFKNGRPVERRIRQFIPVKGLQESFSNSKTRVFDENRTDNTLIPDTEHPDKVHFIAAVEQYLYPAQFIDQGTLPDAIVDSKRMLGDRKVQDVSVWQSIIRGLTELAQLDPTILQRIDIDSIFSQLLRFGEVDDKKVFGDKMQSDVQELLEQVKNFKSQVLDANKIEPTAPQPVDSNIQNVAIPPIDLVDQSPQPPTALTAVAQ